MITVLSLFDGCACARVALDRLNIPCTFGLNFEQELKICEQYEPKLANGVKHVFAPSYEWTRKYKEYVASNFNDNLRY